MPGGNSYLCATLTLAGTRQYDLVDWGYNLSCMKLYNKADCRLYPQRAAAVDHMASIDATFSDLGHALQASSASPIAGSNVGTGGAVLAISANNAGGTTTVTLNPAHHGENIRGAGGQNRLSDLSMSFVAEGTGGTEPVVTVAYAA
jgi:hypothetical protein